MKNVSQSVVADSRTTDNASGIEVHYRGSDLVISGDTIDGNTRYLEASRSATGINFYRTTRPITFAGNEVHGNQLAVLA